MSAIGLCRPIVSVDRPYLTLSERGLHQISNFPHVVRLNTVDVLITTNVSDLIKHRPNVTDVSKTGSMLLALRGSGGQISSKKCYVTHEWPLTLTLKHNLTLP